MNVISPQPVGGFAVFRARDNMRRTTAHAGAVDLSIDLNVGGMARCNLYRQSSGELYTRNPLVSVKTWLETEVAGCYVDLADADEPGEIAALTKMPDASSAPPRQVVARVIVESAPLLPGPAKWKAATRLLPEGFRDPYGRLRKENLPSRRLFEEFLFEAAEVVTCEYKALHRDHHLKDSLEPDRTYRSLILRSTPGTLQAALDFLARDESSRGWE